MGPIWSPESGPKRLPNRTERGPEREVRNHQKCRKTYGFLLFSGFQALRRGLRKQLFGDFASKRPFKTKKVPSEARFGAKLAPQTGPKSLPKRSKFKSNFQSKFGTAPEGHLERKMGRGCPKSPTGRGWGSPWRGVGGGSLPPNPWICRRKEGRKKIPDARTLLTGGSADSLGP